MNVTDLCICPALVIESLDRKSDEELRRISDELGKLHINQPIILSYMLEIHQNELIRNTSNLPPLFSNKTKLHANRQS